MSGEYPARYREIDSKLFVTKPSGEVVARDAKVYWDSRTNTIGILLIGDSPLKGFAFDVQLSEVNRTVEEGEWVESVGQL